MTSFARYKTLLAARPVARESAAARGPLSAARLAASLFR